MALYLIVVQAHFIMNNVFEGMIWFFLPVSLVICNDIFAYICGITFGRTQLIKLSPKKTVEGFVGAWILTIIFGVGMTNVLMRYKYFICPVNVREQPQPHITFLTMARTLVQIFSLALSVYPTPSSYLTSTTSQSGFRT
jgi:CDP-diglyceride synthetase